MLKRGRFPELNIATVFNGYQLGPNTVGTSDLGFSNSNTQRRKKIEQYLKISRVQRQSLMMRSNVCQTIQMFVTYIIF